MAFFVCCFFEVRVFFDVSEFWDIFWVLLENKGAELMVLEFPELVFVIFLFILKQDWIIAIQRKLDKISTEWNEKFYKMFVERQKRGFEKKLK